MSFKDDMARFVAKAAARERMLYKRTVEHALHSIRFGSSVTGAPGQPVQSGELLRSWRLTQRAHRHAEIHSGLVYAPVIEDNHRGAQLRSKVGGFHSVRLTRLGWGRIVAYELGRLGNGGGDGVPAAAPVTVPNAQPRDARGRFARKYSARLKAHG